MKNGICPKCEAKEVYLVKKSVVELFVQLGWAKGAQVGQYLCTNCGYTEFYTLDKSLLPKIAEKFEKVVSREE